MSDLPSAFRRLETIHRRENVFSDMEYIDEVSGQTGLGPQELVVFRPERLALHELIIRVTADITVLEGRDEIELGKNFRRIVRTIQSKYIQPHMGEITQAYTQLQQSIYERVRKELQSTLFASGKTESPARGLFSFGSRKRPRNGPRIESTLERELQAISLFKEKGLIATDPLDRAIYRSLHRVLGSVAGVRGYLGRDRDFLTKLACNYACNSRGGRIIGDIIAPWVSQAVEEEGYSLIPNADTPILISLKGASAAGKSSLRPMLKKVMSEQGIQPDCCGTISPDIWRRLLLDYDSLGAAYKYAGRLTSQEIIVIDSKLDHYVRNKADRHGAIPHLLVDRFRFDSFSSEKVSKILHDTYVRHVDTLYMYFVVTPPEETVKRGWERGLLTGRYKAVEDFLDHSVEAYTGMPKLLFKWLAYKRPLVIYRFLDNSVPKGTYPRTIAFGTQEEMNLIDCSAFIDIVRYQKINVRARTPDEVYPAGPALSVANNAAFLKQCIKHLPRVNFIDEATGSAYVTATNGRFTVTHSGILEEKLRDSERFQIFSEIAPHLCSAVDTGPSGGLQSHSPRAGVSSTLTP